jgi:pimeloyl-ACP methyl ester carboxylesterase
MVDLDDVRAWLGYDRIDLFGLSYGTRAALVYMRQHPDRVGNVVLTGVTPTNHKMPLYHARDGQRAMNLLLEECAADETCNKAFSNIRKELIELLDNLARQPAQAKYILPESGKEVAVTIAGQVFAEKLRSALYTPPGARRLPLIIHRAAQGDFGPFLSMVIPVQRSRPDFIAEGMYLSVTCNEDTRQIDGRAAAEMNRGNIFDNYRVEHQLRACSLWPRARLTSAYSQPVFSRAPVLILSGHMDPITPPAWAKKAARRLPNSRQIIIRHLAHVPVGLSHIECLDKVILEFLDKGDAKLVDANCVDEMLPPRFSTEVETKHN